MVNSIEDMKRCIGEPVKRQISGVEFEFYALGAKYYPLLAELESFFPDGEDTKLSPDASKKVTETTVELIKVMVKTSIPDVDEATLDRFVGENLLELQEVFVELNSKGDSRKDALTRLREIKNGKSPI